MLTLYFLNLHSASPVIRNSFVTILLISFVYALLTLFTRQKGKFDLLLNGEASF